MNTILQNRIEEAAKIYAESEVNRMDTSTYSMHEKKRLKMFDGYDIEEALTNFSKQILQKQWISVEEALPESIAQRVLIVNNNFPFDVYFGRYEYGKWIIEGESENLWITHWAEIPSLKGGEK